MNALLLAMVVSLAAAPEPAAPKTPPQVSGSMRGTFTALVALQPLAATPGKWRDPAHKEEIDLLLTELGKTRHAFPGQMGQEPGLAAILDLFAHYLADLQHRFREGQADYARDRMRTATSFCFACHSRLTASQDYQDLGRQMNALELSAFERAEYLAATRQFDAAIAAYRRLFSTTPKDERGYLEYLRGLRHALSVTVRVKADPEMTVALLQEVAGRKDLPVLLRRHVDRWLKDAQAWRAEKPVPTTSEAQLAKAAALLKGTGSAEVLVPNERDDIRYLRASNYLHEALAKNPRTPRRGEALYMLGVTAAALQDPTLWELDGLYFEACIRENPHTRVARRCFEALSDRVTLGYTGSSGTHVPEDELSRLAALRALAN